MPITTFRTLVATLLLLSAPCVAVAGFKEGLSAYVDKRTPKFKGQ